MPRFYITGQVVMVADLEVGFVAATEHEARRQALTWVRDNIEHYINDAALCVNIKNVNQDAQCEVLPSPRCLLDIEQGHIVPATHAAVAAAAEAALAALRGSLDSAAASGAD
jgi:hypothetical protein